MCWFRSNYIYYNEEIIKGGTHYESSQNFMGLVLVQDTM
uniref:Uncharacterized protein n=1 Tax=Siphoviridae sp. ctLOE2 TaxID=2825454 RepID=A0A8S5PET8_9CAUD|nr:MAG TPA: hypothetical protein [Siphoviridae sp. ctLOE2]